jgi:hypothetical protein
MGDQEQIAAKQQEASPEAVPSVQPPIDPPPPEQPEAPPTPPENPEKIGKSDRIMIAATVVIAFGTLVSAGAICFQWYEMHTGGADTHYLATAAGTQAILTSDLDIISADQATQIKELAKHMGEQADRTKTIAEQAKIQAGAAEKQADSLEAIVRAQYQATPNVYIYWMALYRDTAKKPWAYVRFGDRKKSIEAAVVPASSTRVAFKLEFRNRPPISDPGSFVFFDRDFRLIEDIEVIQSDNDPKTPPIEFHGSSPYQSGRETLYIWGTIKSVDFAKKSTSQSFCYSTTAANILAGPAQDVNGKTQGHGYYVNDMDKNVEMCDTPRRGN